MSKNRIFICSINASPCLLSQHDIMVYFINLVHINAWPNQPLTQNVWFTMSQEDRKKYSKLLATGKTKRKFLPLLVWVFLSDTQSTVMFFFHKSYKELWKVTMFVLQRSGICSHHWPVSFTSVCVQRRSGPIMRRNQSRRLCMYQRRRNEWPTTDQCTSPKSATACTSTPRT